MDETYELVIIGGGEAGQAAAHLVRKLGGHLGRGGKSAAVATILGGHPLETNN